MSDNPKEFGDYLLLEKIGSGGVGTVYKAWHNRLEKMVALKVLNKDAVQSPDTLKRFLREVRTSAQLEHPNIVATFDAGEVDGEWFLVTEYIVGDNLHDYVMDNGPIRFDVAFRYILNVANALRYAHRRNIIHRDIKPANIMRDDDGNIKVLDMGLARIAGNTGDTGEFNLTQSGTVMGTPAYMAPEQASGLTEADQRSDIYSMGCTLYFLMTGNDPFQGDSFIQVVMAHRDKPIPSLLELDAEIPETFDWAFHLMMAKEPKSRYQTMDELIVDLEGRFKEHKQDEKERADKYRMHTSNYQLGSYPGIPTPVPATVTVKTGDSSAGSQSNTTAQSSGNSGNVSSKVEGNYSAVSSAPMPSAQASVAPANRASPPTERFENLQPLVESLIAAKVCKVDHIQAILDKATHDTLPRTAKSFGDALVMEGVLSPFQAALLGRGSVEDLMIRDFLIMDKLSESHRGIAYIVQDPKSKQKYVFKSFSDEFANWKHELPRFESSMAMTKKFSNRHALKVLDYGVYDERPFILTPYITCSDLARTIRRGGVMDLPAAADIVWQIAEVLAAGCRQKMIHLNLKPSQVLLAENDSVLVSDFGLADFNRKLISAEHQLSAISDSTTSSQMLRTEDFAALELLIEPNKADYRSDIFSLGSIFFYLLSGMPLYSRQSLPGLIIAHQDAVIPMLADFQPGLDPKVQKIFEGMVAKKRKDRYQSYEEIQNVIRPYGTGSRGFPEKTIVMKLRRSELLDLANAKEQQAQATSDSVAGKELPLSKNKPKSNTDTAEETEPKSNEESLLPIILLAVAVIAILVLIANLILNR